MIDDEWITERWVRDLERHTPLSELQARAVVARRAGKDLGTLAAEQGVREEVVRVALVTAFKIAGHEWANLDLYPDAAREVEAHLTTSG